MSKELVIDKNTKIDKIENKEEFTKLVINTKVNPKKLANFTNVKELTLDGLNMKKENINERNLNLFPIKDNIEKLVFLNLEYYGYYPKPFSSIGEYYYLDYKNLKSIEFPHNFHIYENDYLTQLINLEYLIFNVKNHNHRKNYLKLNSPHLKNIIIKFYGKEYFLNFDYEIKIIQSIIFDSSNNKILIKVSNYETESLVKINTYNDKIEYENKLMFPNIKNDILYIPDYITAVEEQNISGIEEVNFNLKLLDYINQENRLICFSENNRNVKKIILRNSDNMLLFPEKVIDICKYGKLNRFYIIDKLLKLNYEDFYLIVDSKGNIEKQEKNKQKDLKIDLNNYTANELKEYMCYKMLLEISKENDLEYKKAMEVVEDRVIKRLTKIR